MKPVGQDNMNATAVDALRLSWRYAREGHTGLRDLFLTLAVAESGLNEAVWAEQCRRWLGRTRPGHPFGKHPTVGASLADPRFANELERLKHRYPPSRIRWLLEQTEDGAASNIPPNSSAIPPLQPPPPMTPASEATVEFMAKEITSRCPSWMIRRVSPCDYRRAKAMKSVPAPLPQRPIFRILSARPFSQRIALAPFN